MNFNKSALSANMFAQTYAQVIIGALADNPEALDVVDDSEFTHDLLPHVRALAYAIHVLGDEIDFQSIDSDRDICQEFGRYLVNERGGDLLDITVSDDGALSHVVGILGKALDGLDALSVCISADVFKRSYLAALPCEWDDLAALPAPDVYAEFKYEGYTLKPVALNVETVCGESIDPEDYESVRSEYSHLEDFDQENFFQADSVWYAVSDFMRSTDSILGTVGAYNQSAFSQLLIIPDSSGDSIHVVRVN